MLNRLIAVDWSGAEQRSGQREHIWMADWRRGVVSLTSDRTREETVKAVIDAASEDGSLIAGFDFAFSYPAWFLQEQNCADVDALWELVKFDGERWLRECAIPFWGRGGIKRHPQHYGEPWKGFRRTERDVELRTGKLPKSAFQLVGDGQVGPGSVRGMPYLLNLREAAFSIWPFDPPKPALAVEIYPRLFVGSISVRDRRQREDFLRQDSFSSLTDTARDAAVGSPDAFDAVCALMGMVERAQEFGDLQQAKDPERLLEGEIWMPRQM